MTNIPVFDYLQQYAGLKDEILTAVGRVFKSGRLILGAEVAAFEQEFATFLETTEGAAVGVNSGTDALTIILRSLGIGNGDEVVTVANTAVPTVSAIREVGATPVFCDVDPATCLMSVDDALQRVSSRTRAIIPVHLFGNAVDVPALRHQLTAQDVAVVEDCAQAHGARLRGRLVGTMGHAAAFSFYPTKNLGALGDGGLAYSPDQELAARMRSIRMYGFEDHYYAEREGVNSRLDEVQAAILRVKLPHLAGHVDKRREIARFYDSHLATGIDRVVAGTEVDHAYHLYVVKVAGRDSVRARLAKQGISSGIHYPTPIHRMRAYEFLNYADGSLPTTEQLATQILSLPMFPELGLQRAERVCDAMNAVAG